MSNRKKLKTLEKTAEKAKLLLNNAKTQFG